MANESEGKDQEAPGAGEADRELTVVDCIRAIAAYNARAELTTERQMTLFLKSWWSNLYNRPLKDPLLESYTFEELLYEFYDKMERQKAQEERATTEADKMEEVKEKEVLDWAEEEEKKELAELQKAAANPTQDPENIKWMNEQLEKYKEVYGDGFGDDIEETFDEE
jgi:Mg-chelatase subunit ChlI